MSGELSVAAASLNALPVSLVQIVAQPDCEFVIYPESKPEKTHLPWEPIMERNLYPTAPNVLNRSLDAC